MCTDHIAANFRLPVPHIKLIGTVCNFLDLFHSFLRFIVCKKKTHTFKGRCYLNARIANQCNPFGQANRHAISYCTEIYNLN